MLRAVWDSSESCWGLSETALSHAEGCLGQLWVMSLSQLAHANLSTLDLFPLYNFPKIWQDFPDEQIKIIRQSSEFDAKLKNYFLSDLASNVICNRLFCPACRQGAWEKKKSLYYYHFLLFAFFIRFAVVVLVCLDWSCPFFSIIYLSVYWWNSCAPLP